MNRKWMVTLSIVLLMVFTGFAQAPQFGTIEGTVTLSTDGSPLILFPVNITNLDSNVTVTTYTDQNGNYSLFVLPGNYRVASGDTVNYTPFFQDVTVDVGKTVTVDMALEPKFNSAIAGHVSFKGQGVADVSVFIYAIQDSSLWDRDSVESSSPLFVAVTDSNGDFFQGVPAGEYFVRVPGSNEYLDWNDFVTVAENDTQFLDIVLEEFRTLSGNVANVEDYTWVFVTAHSLNTGRIYFAMPDMNGNYTIKLKPNDTYIVRCDGFIQQHRSLITIFYEDARLPFNATPIEVTSDTSGIDFNLPDITELADFAITGMVTDESTGDPIPGAHVAFVSYNVHYSIYNKAHVVADSSGNYFYEGKTFLAADSVIGFSFKDGYFVEFYDNQPTYLTADPIAIMPNDTVNGIDFSLTPVPTDTQFTISGRVVGDDGSVPPFGQVIAYSTVGVQFAQIDERGNYELIGFPRGTVVILQAWGGFDYIPEFYDDKLSAEEADTLVINDHRQNIDFVLAKRDLSTALGKVSGDITVLTPPGGIPTQSTDDLSGVTVYVRKVGETEWFAASYSDETGKFELPIETYGTYEILATGYGYEDATKIIEVDEQTGLNPQVEIEMSRVVSIDESDQTTLIRTTRLYNAYPNPFNPSTTIRVDMARSQRASLVIYNVLGQKVKVLFDGVMKKGSYKFIWNATDEQGNRVASGLYFYQLKTANGIQTKAMVLMK